jgi:hypothetical protein
MNNPYETTEELVDDHIGWVAAILRGDVLAGAVGSVPARMQATHIAGIELPLLFLEERLGLSESEMRVLWVLLAHELDPEVRQLVRERCTEQVSDITFDVLRRVVYGPRARLRTWRELGPEGRLRTLGLIERTDGAAHAPEQRQTFKVARRVLALAHGDLSIDSEISGIAHVVRCGPQVTALEIEPRAIEAITRAVDRGTGLVIVHGRVGSGRRSALTAAVARPILVVDARAISGKREQAQRELRIIAREALLLGCVPLIQHLDALSGGSEAADRFDLIETELSGLVLATSTRAVRRRWETPVVQVEIPQLCGTACARLWKRALPEASDTDAEQLATMYPLSPALICAAARASQTAYAGAKMRPEHIEAGVRTVLDDRLAGMATRVNITQTWEDLVLPDDQISAIVELLARIRERRRVYEDWGFAEKLGRGLGVSALFSGPPGTGKTMAAGLIARDLGCELYQVDTSKITSKWIGETEKNLAALFDAAEAGHAILLFDEADALFGKRTDVKSSNDRVANQETNYLLQRLETFSGICLLTTNHESSIDEAFRRRLSVHVRFPMPEADERRHLWRALLPTAAPTAGELGIDALADTFVMSGGYIRNAVLRAAFLAADAGTSICGAHLLRAARLEYEALGKVVPALSIARDTRSTL